MSSTASTSESPLRIVLFGLPRAGKTALLAALSQSQETQPALLSGKLEDPSGSLTRQRQLFYDELPRSTEEETVSYPVRLQTPTGPLDAEFIDCDGRTVLELIKKRTSMDQAEGRLPKAVLDADAILLVADPTLKPDLAERVLTAFDEFLRRHELERGRRNDVTGLPVFLVLTKCDLLAEEQDGLSDWMGRIEEQKRLTRHRLDGFLEDDGEARPTSFGRLDVHLWATATRRPALKNSEARPRDPYGVAELFRHCLNEAQQYRRRVETADARLSTTVRGVSGVLGVLALLTAFLFSGVGQHDPSDLERRIDKYRLWQGAKIEERLHDWPGDLEARRKELRGIVMEVEFSALSEEVRREVGTWAVELDEYIPYLKKVLQTQMVASVRTEKQLQAVERRLEEATRLPTGKEEEWAKTGASKLRQQRLADLRLLREQADKAVVWYQKLFLQGEDLRKFRRPPRENDLIAWGTWQEEVEKYLRKALEPPDDTRKIPAQSLITSSTVLRFDKVQAAREAVLGPERGGRGRTGVVQELEAMRDISYALGLLDAVRDRPPLLVLPRSVTPEEAAQRWRSLASHPEMLASLVGLARSPGGMGPLLTAATFSPGNPLVPLYFDFDRMFRLTHVTEAAQGEVVRAASESHRAVLEPLRRLVRERYKQLGTAEAESPERWKAVADWLASDPQELLPYRRLALVLDRLRRADAVDPVTALAEFLTRMPTPHVLSGAQLTLSDDVGVRTVPESAVLLLKVGAAEVRMLRDPGQAKRDPQERRTTYHFSAQRVPVTFQPGQVVSLTLALPDDRVLTWNSSRTRTFAVEALSRLPWLHGKDEAPSDGNRAEGAILKLDGTPPLPAIPELLPALK